MSPNRNFTLLSHLRNGRSIAVAVLSLSAGILLNLRAPAAAAADAASGGGGELQEVVVTATRREETLSRVPISVSAFTQESIDVRGIKDFQDVARFTPGVNIDNTGTNNISIRGIASTAGAGTTGIYIDDTPIQMRALAFNPDDTLPKTFDIDRVEVLRGPQGTLFGSGSEGGTVRYITTQPSLTKTSVYSRLEYSSTTGGDPSYEAGVAAGGPIIEGKFGARVSVWYRKDGGWIDRVDPTNGAIVEKNSNHDETTLIRLAGIWAPNDSWTITPSIYLQDRQRNDPTVYWPIFSNPGNHDFKSGNPTQRAQPDKFTLPALKIEGDLGPVRLISNTSYYDRKNTTGYDGTLYNLGFYQTFGLTSTPLLDGTGVHLPPGLTGYRSPASIQNNQQSVVQEIRLQSNDPASALQWTAGLFYTSARQTYTEEIHDQDAEAFFQQLAGSSVADYFAYCAVDANPDGSCPQALTPLPLLANGDSYILNTIAKDQQTAFFGEATYSFTDQFKATLGARFSRSKYTFSSYTAGPQLFGAPISVAGDKTENSFTPKVSLSYQMDPKNLFYFTYAKGFRPGGGNNPVPQAACAEDFQNFGITSSPKTFNSDTVQSFEVGSKNNLDNRVRLASSIYFIKWKNIQQTVVPPICQISWIANLGTAEAKGVDIQADIAVTERLALEIAAGYTDARYTADSILSATVGPTVAKGDAIVGQSGQPPAPFTASVGLEYKFTVMERESFIRVDYQHDGTSRWPGARQDPATLQYDPANFKLPATNFVTMRAGVTLGGWQVAAFVDNLTDSKTLTNYDFTIDPGTTFDPNGSSRLQRSYTFRPRTVGLSFTYRE